MNVSAVMTAIKGCFIFIGLCAVFLVFCIVMMVKNENTYSMQMKIARAIYYYHISCIEQRKTCDISYEDMESYNRTLYRIWDWGYKNILPKEKFEIVKEYIEEDRCSGVC